MTVRQMYSKNLSSIANVEETSILRVKETPRAMLRIRKTNKRLLNLRKSPRALSAVRLALSKKKSLNSSTPPEKLYMDQRMDKDSNHSSTHFIKGGTPCDPVCPPYRLAMYGEESVYTLVLLRHGESEWNKENRYTGWCDVNLTNKGKAEARNAGRQLKEHGIQIDHAFTSVLRRASVSANMALSASDQFWVPITKSWRLNERHYGALQGYNKCTAYKELGIDQEVVMEMRRSYDARPPPMDDNHEHWHAHDRRYKKLTTEQLERTRAESLEDTANRILPFFNSVITPSLRAGNKCLIVSHANSIRTLVKHIDNISDHDIKGISIPTGIPLVYRLDKNLKPVDPDNELEFRHMVNPKGYTWGTSRQHGFHGVYLGDLERLQKLQQTRDRTNRDWQRVILTNLAKSANIGEGGNDTNIMSTRQLWWKVHSKMKEKEFSCMLLLQRMNDELERRIHRRGQRYITFGAFECILAKIHLDAEGQVVEPFVNLSCTDNRQERARRWNDALKDNQEEQCL